MTNDLFNRKDLIGDQSIETINNFTEYIDSLLNPFNNKLTELILDLNSITISKEIQYKDLLINNLQIKNSQLLNKYTLINISNSISSQTTAYISTLTTSKNNFTAIFNSKATSNSPLTRPTTRTILDTNYSLITKQYAINELTKYSLPTPIANTKLYVNKTSNGFVWAK